MSNRMRIIGFILFAVGIFLFIQIFSRNPASVQQKTNITTIGQVTLPTQADGENEVRTSVYTSKANDFSFEYPADWEATKSATLTPDTGLGVLSDTAVLVSPDGKKGVIMQIYTNSTNIKTEALFGCTSQANTCQKKSISQVETIQTTTKEGSGSITRIGAVKNNKIYSLKILGPPESLISSVSFP